MTGEDELDEFSMTVSHDAGVFDPILLQGRKGHSRAETCGKEVVNRNQQAPSLSAPPLNTIHKGIVKNIKPFGAFVSISGYDRDGLVHISKLSAEGRVDRVEDVLAVGDYVWAKVIDHDPEVLGKYCLDMRFVSQVDGSDKDHNNVHLGDSHPHSQWKTQPAKATKIELDAILKTTCTRCGGTGHLTFECYADITGKGKHYELLDESEDDPSKSSCSHAGGALVATGSNAAPLKPNSAGIPLILERGRTNGDIKEKKRTSKHRHKRDHSHKEHRRSDKIDAKERKRHRSGRDYGRRKDSESDSSRQQSASSHRRRDERHRKATSRETDKLNNRKGSARSKQSNISESGESDRDFEVLRSRNHKSSRKGDDALKGHRPSDKGDSHQNRRRHYGHGLKKESCSESDSSGCREP